MVGPAPEFKSDNASSRRLLLRKAAIGPQCKHLIGGEPSGRPLPVSPFRFGVLEFLCRDLPCPAALEDGPAWIPPLPGLPPPPRKRKVVWLTLVSKQVDVPNSDTTTILWRERERGEEEAINHIRANLSSITHHKNLTPIGLLLYHFQWPRGDWYKVFEVYSSVESYVQSNLWVCILISEVLCWMHARYARIW